MEPRPETRYARSGDLWIAYQVTGEGPDLIYLPGSFFYHVDLIWDEPSGARFLRRLASFSRLIRFDRRGEGLSDQAPGIGTLEEQIDDVLAVMDAVGSERAALFGSGDGAQMAAGFAATQRDRTSALIFYSGQAHSRGPGISFDELKDLVEQAYFGVGPNLDTAVQTSMSYFAPSVAEDPTIRAWWRRFIHQSASPGRVLDILKRGYEIDIRPILPAITAPTLLLRRTGVPSITEQDMKEVASLIPDVKAVELPGIDQLEWYGDSNAIADEIEEFLTGARRPRETDRILATVLFVDIVGSTQRAAELGDQGWRRLLERFYDVVRQDLEHFRGKEVKTTGDGVLATFDGPARAIRCAESIIRSARALGIEIRTGLHTGECEVMGDDVGGIAVHIAARVVDIAAPAEVLVSRTVKDLVAGSGIEFEDRGMRELKGVPDEWQLYAVKSSS